MVNAYQIHCQEFDCVHEGAVVHAMATALPCLLGWAERAGGVNGDRFIRSVVAAIDISATLGLCSRAPMRFFRPATAGGFGAIAGLALLAGLDGEQTRDALGIYYGQCAGTMQAHVEASPQLAMQIGFAARNAIAAVELANRFMPGPRAPISGPFGYFALFDGRADPAPFDDLGRVWRIAELSHKPFPSGRATHGGVDAVLRLVAAYGVTADQVTAGRFYLPPLTLRLVGRPARTDMTIAYARLCLPYVAAVSLTRGAVRLADFTTQAIINPEILELAGKLTAIDNGNPDPNAMAPIRCELDLAGGQTLACDVGDVLGSPARPLSPEAARTKFDACCADALSAEHVWDAVAALDDLSDMRNLVYNWSQR
jgi:2-methylcitrate dehydratase PrpD